MKVLELVCEALNPVVVASDGHVVGDNIIWCCKADLARKRDKLRVFHGAYSPRLSSPEASLPPGRPLRR